MQSIAFVAKKKWCAFESQDFLSHFVRMQVVSTTILFVVFDRFGASFHSSVLFVCLFSFSFWHLRIIHTVQAIVVHSSLVLATLCINPKTNIFWAEYEWISGRLSMNQCLSFLSLIHSVSLYLFKFVGNCRCSVGFVVVVVVQL